MDKRSYYKNIKKNVYLSKPVRSSELTQGASFTWGVNSSPGQTWGWVRAVRDQECPEEVEEWADIDLDLNLWHLDLEEVANWGIGEVGVHAMETECHQQAPAKGSIRLSMRMSSPGDVGWVVVRSAIREFLRLTAA